MRRAFLMGLGIGAGLGMAWLLALMGLFGRNFLIQHVHWATRPMLYMFLLLGIIGGAVAAWFKLED